MYGKESVKIYPLDSYDFANANVRNPEYPSLRGANGYPELLGYLLDAEVSHS